MYGFWKAFLRLRIFRRRQGENLPGRQSRGICREWQYIEETCIPCICARNTREGIRSVMVMREELRERIPSNHRPLLRRPSSGCFCLPFSDFSPLLLLPCSAVSSIKIVSSSVSPIDIAYLEGDVKSPYCSAVMHRCMFQEDF